MGIPLHFKNLQPLDGDTLGPFSWSSPAGGVWTLEGADAHGVPILGPNQQKCAVFLSAAAYYRKWYLSFYMIAIASGTYLYHRK